MDIVAILQALLLPHPSPLPYLESSVLSGAKDDGYISDIIAMV